MLVSATVFIRIFSSSHTYKPVYLHTHAQSNTHSNKQIKNNKANTQTTKDTIYGYMTRQTKQQNKETSSRERSARQKFLLDLATLSQKPLSLFYESCPASPPPPTLVPLPPSSLASPLSLFLPPTSFLFLLSTSFLTLLSFSPSSFSLPLSLCSLPSLALSLPPPPFQSPSSPYPFSMFSFFLPHIPLHPPTLLSSLFPTLNPPPSPLPSPPSSSLASPET